MGNIKVKTEKRYPMPHYTSAVYGFILGYFEDHKYMPALSEIAEAFGKSKMWAKLMVDELQRQKRIKVLAGKHRGIILINAERSIQS